MSFWDFKKNFESVPGIEWADGLVVAPLRETRMHRGVSASVGITKNFQIAVRFDFRSLAVEDRRNLRSAILRRRPFGSEPYGGSAIFENRRVGFGAKFVRTRRREKTSAVHREMDQFRGTGGRKFFSDFGSVFGLF